MGNAKLEIYRSKTKETQDVSLPMDLYEKIKRLEEYKAGQGKLEIEQRVAANEEYDFVLNRP